MGASKGVKFAAPGAKAVADGVTGAEGAAAAAGDLEAAVAAPVGGGAIAVAASVPGSGKEPTAQEPGSQSRNWDQRLASAATLYRLMMYNLMTSNCHCFVAHFLNQASYKGGGWDMVNVAIFVFLRGRYTSVGGFLYTWLPWAIIVGLGGYFGRLWFLYGYLIFCVPLLAWFVLYTKCCWRDLSP
ncbi:hypothetical protein GPECTOR_7g1304 [Gonium pectorale]|uniref:Uncharacterized protein n=1 Tax=Gonium pectorale TaxID=33097 RepID=A0A150GU64_GONPE|nr:hypothetical protein GPECTOR_7g1304 [Gonium pectorale]|eukprot:KXZ53407.1 hypothetical protein GPECTOR_7g1304 [Gonium pectorale]